MVERNHIVNAFRFELTRVQVTAIRSRMVSSLLNVDEELARKVAEGVGLSELPPPMPKVLKTRVKPEVQTSPALSLMARPGDGSIKTRRVVLLVENGVDATTLMPLGERLAAEGAVRASLARKWVALKPPMEQG